MVQPSLYLELVATPWLETLDDKRAHTLGCCRNHVVITKQRTSCIGVRVGLLLDGIAGVHDHV